MAARKKLNIDGIPFDTGGPTAVALDRLYTWVVWQFPRPRAALVGAAAFAGQGGAVHPTAAEHGWYPAIVDAAAGRVLIFANVPEPFISPELAARHLDGLPE